MQRLLWIFLSFAFVSANAFAKERHTKALYLGNHFATGPRIPVCGDFNNDGQTDLACVYTKGQSIVDVALMSKALKFHSPRAVIRAVGGETLAAIAGEFNGLPGSDIAILLKDGRLFLAHSLLGTKMSLALVGTFREQVSEKHREGLKLCKKTNRSQSKNDELIIKRSTAHWLRFRFDKQKVVLSGHKAGSLETDRGPFRPARLAKSALLRFGDFNGDKVEDVLAFKTGTHRYSRHDINLFLGIPTDKKVTDSDCDGVSDKEEKRLGSDPYDLDSDDDGLLDGWEVNGHGDLDLASMGCSPTRQDAIVYIQRWSDVSGARIAKDWKRVVAYFGSLPVKTGRSTGIGLHGIFLPPLKRGVESRTHWSQLGRAHLPSEVWGLAHYMVVSSGGGGQSSVLGTMGSCGANAFYAVFIHEFGHQLGLSHTGGDKPAWCPIYPSLMNYAYSYSLNGKRGKISYSTGKLAGHVLREDQLREELPFAFKDVSFLAQGPYHYRLKKAGPKKTLIDWNRNGQFDKGLLKADINSGYSTTAGKRHTLGKTVKAPVLIAVNKKAFLFWISENGRLKSRLYKGRESWTKAADLGSYKVLRDPAGIGHKGLIFLALPCESGVKIFTGKNPDSVKEQYLLPASKGREVSLTVFQDQPYALLWNPNSGRVSLLELHADSAGRAIDLPVRSDIAPAACEDPVQQDLVLGVTGTVRGRKNRWRVVRLFKEERAGWMIKSQVWVEGAKGRAAGSLRPLLFFEAGSGVGLNGRLHWIAPGTVSKKRPSACFYDAMSVGDTSYHSGWMVKRYYDQWTRTESPLGAVWYEGDILLAYRWHGGKSKHNNLHLAHWGLGINKNPMSDHNDIEVISKFGLSHSIRWLAPWKAVKKQP
jgi:hypothetical protein